MDKGGGKTVSVGGNERKEKKDANIHFIGIHLMCGALHTHLTSQIRPDIW